MPRQIVAEFDAATSPFVSSVRKLDGTINRFDRGLNQRLDRMDKRWETSARMVGTFKNSVIALSTALSVQAVVRYADAWTRVESKLRSIGATSKAAQEQLIELSLATRTDLESNAQTVARIQKATGDSYEQTIRRVETLNKLLASAGASTQERFSTQLQFSQALQSGQLGGEELRALRENAPIELLDAIAQAAGGTREEIKQLGADGKLTTEVMKSALDSLAQTADVAFSKVELTVGDALSNLQTGLSVFVGAADDASGATTALSLVLDGFGRFLAENERLAQLFGQSLQVLGIAALATAGSRGIGALNTAFKNLSVSRQKAFEANQAALEAALKENQFARQTLANKKTVLALSEQNLNAQKQTSAAVNKHIQIQKEVERAQVKFSNSSDRLNAALRQQAVNFQNLSGSARLTAGAMNGLRNAMAFFGGPIGLAFTALTVGITLFRQETISATDGIVELEDSVSNLRQANEKLIEIDRQLFHDKQALEEAQKRLTEESEKYADAVSLEGSAAQEAARLEIDAIQQRLNKRQELRQATIDEAKIAAQQAEQEAAAIRERVLQSFQRDFFVGRGGPAARRIQQRRDNPEQRRLEALQQARENLDAGNASARDLKILEDNAALARQEQLVREQQALVAELERIQAREGGSYLPPEPSLAISTPPAQDSQSSETVGASPAQIRRQETRERERRIAEQERENALREAGFARLEEQAQARALRLQELARLTEAAAQGPEQAALVERQIQAEQAAEAARKAALASGITLSDERIAQIRQEKLEVLESQAAYQQAGKAYQEQQRLEEDAQDRFEQAQKQAQEIAERQRKEAQDALEAEAKAQDRRQSQIESAKQSLEGSIQAQEMQVQLLGLEVGERAKIETRLRALQTLEEAGLDNAQERNRLAEEYAEQAAIAARELEAAQNAQQREQALQSLRDEIALLERRAEIAAQYGQARQQGQIRLDAELYAKSFSPTQQEQAAFEEAFAKRAALQEQMQHIQAARDLLSQLNSEEGLYQKRIQEIIDLQPFLTEQIFNRAVAHDAAITMAEAEAQAQERIAEAINNLNAEHNDLQKTMEQMQSSAKQTFEDIVFGAKSAEDGLKSLALQFSKLIFKSASDGLFSQFNSAFSGAGSTASSGGGGLFSGLSSVFQFHKGGVVGKDGERRFAPMSMFEDVPSFHDGGWPGLRPNEVPAILERGERVLTAQQQREQMKPDQPIININIDARGASRQTENRIRQSARQIGDQVFDAVKRAQRYR